MQQREQKEIFEHIWKMVNKSVRIYENSGVEVIVDNKEILFLNEKHIEEESKYRNLPVIKKILNSEFRKHKYELVDKPRQHADRIFLHEKLALTVIKECRKLTSVKFRAKLSFSIIDAFNTEKQIVLGLIMDAFEGENMRSITC